MASKEYWQKLEDIMSFTGELCGEDMSEDLKEIRERKALAKEGPSEYITLDSLGREFIDVVFDTADSYSAAKTPEEKLKIRNEVKDATGELIHDLKQEATEVIGEAFRTISAAILDD